MDILALDFDGVICDSAGEAAVAGWRGAARLWPGRFQGDPPAEMIEEFRQVRPVMETGYESILLARLLRDGYTVPEILESSTGLFSGLMRDACITRDELVPLFGETRDRWIADDLRGWLDMHDDYEGIVDALNQSDLPVYIITTKEKRFALSLCDDIALRIPEADIFGLESGNKQHVLAKLSGRHENPRFHFVEDRLPTLMQMVDGVDFDVRLYFATWGYHTADERDKADTIPQINVLTQDQFPRFVNMPSRFSA